MDLAQDRRHAALGAGINHRDRQTARLIVRPRPDLSSARLEKCFLLLIEEN
jgi:hypothetical protein